VRIDIKVRGDEIAVTHEPVEHDPFYKNVEVAVRDDLRYRGAAARS
jgi:hypothetical protein